ncbi:MAG: amino acid adenylation domain-containing protein, partial [Cyanobacteria bacterium J06626_6]
MKEINSRIESLSPAKRAILEQRLREKQDDDGLIPRVMIPGRSPRNHASDEAGDEADHEVTLSSAQRRLWFIDQVTPGNAAYNRPTHFRLTGELQADALAQSLSAIVQRHRVLRMTFRAVAGEPVGVVGPALDIPLPVVDLAGLDEAAQAAQIQQIAWQAGQHPFDLSQGPLLRAQLLRLGAQTHILLVNIHHIVFDGWSVSVFQASLAHFYQAFVTGQPVTLPALPLQYDDFAQWQQQRLSSAELAPQLDYWKSQLQGELPVLDLSASLSSSLSAEQERQGRQLAGQSVRQSGVGSEGRSYVHTLPPALGDRLQAFSQREGVTLFMTLLAAFQTLLYRYTQQSDVVVGTPVAGRDRIELEPLIGVFINTLALRTSFEQKPTCQQLLRQVQKTTLEAYAHQMLPFEKLVEEIQPERQAGQTPIFQTLLQLRNLPNERLVSGELEIEPFKLDRTFVDLDLSVDIVECSEGLVCTFLYRSELFDEATIRRMAGHFQRLLESFVATPTAAVDELPLLTDSEHHQLLTQWQGERVGLPDELCVHRLIEAQVEKTPDAIAVAYESETLTYRELNDQASQLGRFLQRKGVGPDQRVGLCVVRSPQMLVGLLAILKAGGAYVPIDPSYPQSRIDFILSDAQVSALLTSTAIAERLALATTTTSTDGATDGSADGSVTALTVVCLDDDTWNQESLQAAGQPVENCGGDVQPHNLAYVIYTSGSTGQPKGVMVEHRSVVNLAIALERELSAAALPSVASQSLPQGPPQSSPHTPTQPPLNVSLNGPLAFDTSVKQIVQLLGGHRLEVVPDALRFDGKELLAFLQQRKIDRFDCTPSQLQLLVEAGLLDCAGAPAQILVGGEPIGRELWARLAHAKHSQFYNVYGPTECTVDATICQILPTEKPATIGQALANVQLYNLDAQRRPVPVGVPGELYVGGHGLARGYLNRPELTAERFVAHSFRDRAQDHSPIRLYKTGDRVRFLPGGRVEYIGRIDNQVKLRGHRIELGEIETALAQHPLVSAAVVILDGGNKRLEEKRLVGYVASEAALTGSELYQSLKGKLPDYMVPAAFVVLERLPLTANGKIDRRSLPAPDPSQRVLKTEFVAPRDDLEQRLAEMWAELLPAEQIGIDDNFFELGGHSLLATRVVARVHAALGVEVPVVDLFEHVTIAQLGARIRELQASGDAHSNGSGQIVPLVARCDRSQPIPASSTQQRW